MGIGEFKFRLVNCESFVRLDWMLHLVQTITYRSPDLTSSFSHVQLQLEVEL